MILRSNIISIYIFLSEIIIALIYREPIYCNIIDAHYNMVGVTVAMVISTMHEKSCIDSHNARKFEKKFQNSVIHTSRNHNDEIAEVSPSLIF